MSSRRTESLLPRLIAAAKSPFTGIGAPGNLWEKIFKNYALKSMDAVCQKLREAILYIERNPDVVKFITSFPYIANSF